MVNWITKKLGVMSASSKLKKDEFGTIIVDLRDIVDGSNSIEDVIMAYNKVLSAAGISSNLKCKVVLQCEAGISRSCAFVVALLYRASDMEWEDAIDFVKKKVPQCQMNLDLLDSI